MNQNLKIISRRLSRKISTLSFLMSISIIYLHSYNIGLFLNIEQKNLMTYLIIFFEKFISQGVTRIATPSFFIISGFLFFVTFDSTFNTYKKKIKSRFFSTFIPYIIWNTIYYIFFTIPYYIPYLRNFINNYNNNPTFKNFLISIFNHEFNGVFWFLKYLIILFLISPIVYQFLKVKKCAYVFVFTLFSIWLIFSNPLQADFINGLLFFSLGGLLSLHHFDLIEAPVNNDKKEILLLTLLWFLFISLYIFTDAPFWLSISIYIGIYSMWGLIEMFKVFDNVFIHKFSIFSFGIYASHQLILETIKTILIIILGGNIISRFYIFIIAPLITLLIILIMLVCLKKYCIKVYKPLMGFRNKK